MTEKEFKDFIEKEFCKAITKHNIDDNIEDSLWDFIPNEILFNRKEILCGEKTASYFKEYYKSRIKKNMKNFIRTTSYIWVNYEIWNAYVEIEKEK